MIKVVCPFTKLHPVTRSVLESYAGLDVRFWDVSHDDHAYGHLMRLLWLDRQPITIVEHDIVPWPGCIEELHACPAKWCANSYDWNGGIGVAHMLGCAKLSARLMVELPNVWDEPCHWSQCDQRLFFAAREVGIEPHLHRPPVIHLKGMAA